MNQPLSFPRLCAHRGFHMAAPENTLPAFSLALETGAPEMELDLWPSKDGHLMVCHDPDVYRTCGVKRLIRDMTTKELRALDAGSWFGPAFRDARLPLFEEVLELCGGKALLNVHIKSPLENNVQSEKLAERDRVCDYYHDHHIPVMPPLPEGTEEILPEIENRPWTPYSEGDFLKILSALDACGGRDWVYITGEADVLTTARGLAPDLPRCCLEGYMNYTLVEHAVEYGCQRVQFTKQLTTKAMVERARARGLICNMFWADDVKEAAAYFEAGMDCILTNNAGPLMKELF